MSWHCETIERLTDPLNREQETHQQKDNSQGKRKLWLGNQWISLR